MAAPGRTPAGAVASPAAAGDAGEVSATARWPSGDRHADAVPRVGPPRFGLLLGTVVASFAVQGAIPSSPVQQIVVTALAAASLVLSLRAAQVRSALLRAGVALAAAGVAVSVLQALAGEVGDGAARTTNAALLLFGPPAVAFGVLRDLRLHRRVRLQAVMGVIALYVLVGMLFGFVYGALDRLGGDPVFAGAAPATVARCLYFSFATLATVGYGDVVTRSDLGHTLAISEALLGQLYLVTIVSLVVSNLGRQARDPSG